MPCVVILISKHSFCNTVCVCMVMQVKLVVVVIWDVSYFSSYEWPYLIPLNTFQWPFTLGSISAASCLSLKFTPYLLPFVITYRIYSNRRRGVYFIFRDPAAAFIRGRRLFGDGVYSKITLFSTKYRTRYGNFFENFIEANAENKLCARVTGRRKREVGLVVPVPAKFSALTAELRVAKILERELNTRAKKYSHFELKNVVLKENKFPLLV